MDAATQTSFMDSPKENNHHQPLGISNASDIEIVDQEVEEHPNLNSSNSISHHPFIINGNNMMQLHADEKRSNSKRYMPLLIINFVSLFVGSVSSSLLSKYYFIHKGSNRWVSTLVQSTGFPLLIIAIYLPYVLKFTERQPFSNFNKRIWVYSIFVGFMLGLNNLLFSWGNSYLPVSTSALLLSSQLAFNLILSVIIVKQKITFLNLNCVILLTLGSVLLGLDSNHEKPQALTKAKYFVGYFCTIGAGLLFALYLPVMERIYRTIYCYEMVMEMQLIMEVVATILATVGMLLDNGFSAMKEESKSIFDKGSTIYWVTVMGNVVTWQFCFMGTAGMVFLTSSITGGISMTALLSMNVLGGVVVYGDNFDGFKGVSTALCLWGFSSYVYGMHINIKDVKGKTNEDEPSSELAHISNT